MDEANGQNAPTKYFKLGNASKAIVPYGFFKCFNLIKVEDLFLKTQVGVEEEGREKKCNFFLVHVFLKRKRLISYSINCKAVKETDFGDFFLNFWLGKVV